MKSSQYDVKMILAGKQKEKGAELVENWSALLLSAFGFTHF
ncbi:hypothetical protein [Oceanisphaera sp.]